MILSHRWRRSTAGNLSSIAALYAQDRIKITTGVGYIKLEDARPEIGTPDTARAQVEGI